MRISIIVATTLGLSLSSAANARPNLPSCPGLDSSGKRLPISPGPVINATSQHDDVQPVPQGVADAARKAIGFFESGGGDAYANVSSLDTISIGYLQWNWGTGSLINRFVAKLEESDIELAPEPLRSDLAVLKAYQLEKPGAKAGADRVVGKWTSSTSEDPVSRGVRKSVRGQLEAWLAEPAIKSAQDELIDPKLRLAYSYARQWMADSADIGGAKGNVEETTTSFFDLLTYNDGRQGLWVPHVREFRSQFSSNREIIDFIADWTISCELVVKPGQRDTKLYNTGEASANARKWKAKVGADPQIFTDNQVNLLIFGFLRALSSVGANPPVGFHGIFQADVMLRRGAVALGTGTIRGKSVETVLN